MARYRAQGWHKAFEKSHVINLSVYQREREQRKLEEERELHAFLNPTYDLYVGERLVHSYHEWYEAHTTFTAMYAIDEWHWLPLSCSLNGKPIWGTTSQGLAQNKAEARRYKANRTRYLNKCNMSELEREESAQKKLAQIVANSH